MGSVVARRLLVVALVATVAVAAMYSKATIRLIPLAVTERSHTPQEATAGLLEIAVVAKRLLAAALVSVAAIVAVFS